MNFVSRSLHLLVGCAIGLLAARMWLGGAAPGVLAPVTNQAAAREAVAQVSPAPSLTPTCPSAMPSAASHGDAASAPALVRVPDVKPTVLSTLRADDLAKYQAQVEQWTCEGSQCVANLRLPATVDASRQHDMTAPSRIFSALKGSLAASNVDVSIRSISNEPTGMAMSFQFTSTSAGPGRYYSESELAAIRMDSFEKGRKEGAAGSRK
jgi:hypothetical protein